MIRSIAQVISYLFHPLALPIYAIFLFSATNSAFQLYLDPEKTGKLALIFIGISFVAPLVYIFYLKQTGAIDNVSDPNRKSRLIVSIVVLVFYAITYFLFKRIQLNDVFYDLFFGVIVAIAIATIISFWYKISMHGLSVGGLLGAQCALFFLHNYLRMDILLLLILLIGLVGTSRAIVKAHTNDQIYSGVLLGATVVAAYLIYGTSF
ncbi:MAG: hypothetical protein HKN39_03705 [Flavobacteriales bacterium]|nr:hypothetical protein [Flavobacteriales bacterium]